MNASIPDWIAAIGGLAGFSALGIELWTRRNRKYLPPESLLASLQWLHQSLTEILASGGQESQWFLESDRQRQSSLLAILNGQIADDELNRLVGAARSGYGAAWVSSPGYGTLANRGNNLRVQRQLEEADKANIACRNAIDRANSLIRKNSR